MLSKVKSWQAELMLLFMTLIWGATFLFTKFGLENCPPFLYVVLRFIVAGVVLLLFFGNRFKKINKKTLKSGAVLGTFFGIGFMFQTYGLELTSITKSAFITGLTVVITPFIYKILSKKKELSIWPKIGVIVAGVGLWIFTNPSFDTFNFGDLLTLISTVFWALYINYMDIYTKDVENFTETIHLVGLQFLFVLPFPLLGFLTSELHDFYINFNSELITSLAFNGILASFILTLIHTTFQRYTSPVKAALIFSMEPVFAALIAAIVIGEILSGSEYLGASLLMLGILISELGSYFFERLNIFK